MSGDTRPEAVVEADVTQSMIKRVEGLLARADYLANMSQEDLDRNYPDEASRAALAKEQEACTQRAATILAKYGIDRAMLAASGALADGTVDRVIMLDRPFAGKMRDLLMIIADSLGAKVTTIKTWNDQSGPKARGGVPRGGWDYGIRIFAYGSDLQRIEILYSTLRNQALAGVSRIVNKGTTFGQAQKADRESYLDGWNSGLYRKLRQAEEDARKAAEAEEEERRDQALINGTSASQGPGVALVLADRKKALDLAYDLARGITPALREQWDADGKRYAEEARQAREAREADIAACKKCQKAKSGRCNDHREKSYGRSYRAYERTGQRWSDGYADGQQADLGTTGPQVSSDSGAMAIG